MYVNVCAWVCISVCVWYEYNIPFLKIYMNIGNFLYTWLIEGTP